MKPYNKKATCKKCGCVKIASHYHRESGKDCGYSSNCICVDIKWKGLEHILRVCENCSYEWLEKPLIEIINKGVNK